MDLSILLYILTFLIGVGLDFFKQGRLYVKARRIYVFWLYIFLCFGYMTGSDWRSYEVFFNDLTFVDLKYFNKEIGFWFVFWLLKQAISDFWFLVGIIKCIYLYTLIRLLKKITIYWIASLAILLPISLTFILIDNPLRFMCALVFIHFCMIYLIDKKYLKSIVCIFASILMHVTSIFFFLLIPCFVFADKISQINRVVVGLLYAILIILSSQMEYLQLVFSQIGLLFETTVLETKFESYSINNSNILMIGNVAKIFFFLFLLSTKYFILKLPKGNIIYSICIVYFIFDRFLSFVDTGFRLIIPMGYMYAILIASLLVTKKTLGYVFLVYYSFSYTVNIWTSWKMIPYTNSIPYIVIGHKPYNERSVYNLNAYKSRINKVADHMSY